jgi:hypothetical protein
MDYPEKVKKLWDEAKGAELAISGTRLMEIYATIPYPIHGDRWGKWEFDAKRLCLVFDGAGGYEVDLEEMTTSAQMLDWIFQVSNKAWAERKDVGDLIQALEDLLHPQGTLCSGGIGGQSGKEFNPTDYLKKHLKNHVSPSGRVR